MTEGKRFEQLFTEAWEQLTSEPFEYRHRMSLYGDVNLRNMRGSSPRMEFRWDEKEAPDELPRAAFSEALARLGEQTGHFQPSLAPVGELAIELNNDHPAVVSKIVAELGSVATFIFMTRSDY